MTQTHAESVTVNAAQANKRFPFFKDEIRPLTKKKLELNLYCCCCQCLCLRAGERAVYRPDLVMIISVPSSWNLSHSSLVSRLHEIFAISSLGMPGLVGMSGSVHTPGALPLKSPCPSSEDRSARDCWLQEDFSTNCSFI